MDDKITCKITINSSSIYIWKTFFDTERWWRDMKLLPQKGSDFIEEWVGEDGVLRRTIGRVSKLNEPHHVELVWRDEDWPAETLVVVTFSEKSGSTQVVLVHSGWGNLALPQLNEVKRSHIAGWNYHLAMLKAAVEAE